MRTALEQIKAELGADAVIMSNKKIPEGVELMAAVDYAQQVPASAQAIDNQAKVNADRVVEDDVVSISSKTAMEQKCSATTAPSDQPVDSLSALLQRKVQAEQSAQTANTPHSKATVQANEQDIEQQLKNFTDRLEQGMLGGKAVVKNETVPQQSTHACGVKSDTTPSVGQTQASAPPQPTVAASAEIEQMRQEMQSMRQLLEHQVSGLMWQDMAQKDPIKALMVNRLVSLGLNEQVADQVASYVSTQNNEQQAWEEAKQLLTQQLNTTNNDIIHRGGVVSLVGPTGVGKTTTVAKLAARFAQIHGADQVAMISTDSYRIAGFEQLSTYGRIIGCQVKLAKDGAALETLLQQFSNKKLILIDTAGMGQRDMRLAEHLATLITNSRVRIRNYLVLAANAQQRVMQENVERFKKVPLAGCIYTKLDESLSVGEIIATSIQNGLAIGYLTDGQRVPEDIKVANAEKLVTLADRLATKVNRQESWRPMPTSHAVGV